MMPRASTTLFTGRRQLLDELDKTTLQAVQNTLRATSCSIVISGVGGQGKSELALQIAQLTRSRYWGVFWVDVSTPLSAQNGFLEIAARIGAPASDWREGQQALASTRQPWLLVLDNADELNVNYQEYYPPSCPTGTIVLTTRNFECGIYASDPENHIPLDGLSQDEAIELLLKTINLAHQRDEQLIADARNVATLLHSHALALTQAGAYIKKGHCTLATYPKEYERQRKRLLKFRPTQAQSRYGDIYATFEASAEILNTSQETSSQDALELLSLLAVCASSALPLATFGHAWERAKIVSEWREDPEEWDFPSTWHIDRLPAFLLESKDAWDDFRLKEAVHVLEALALVSIHTDSADDTFVSMHPLVHA
jgi:hypothetical protein